MIIARGAEAVLEKEKGILRKNRIKKSYRLPQIDKRLRSTRTKTEARLLTEARRIGVPTPRIVDVGKNEIKMEFLYGPTLREVFDTGTLIRKQEKSQLAYNIGTLVALLHKAGIVHGDLTTSNLMLRGADIIFIDFGLGYFSQRTEDYATDLSVLREAVLATHHEEFKLIWDSIKKGYSWDKSNKVFKCLDDIERRGRYVKRSKK